MIKKKNKEVTVLNKRIEIKKKKNKVTYFKGTGSFRSKNETKEIRTKKKKETKQNKQKNKTRKTA